MKKKYKFKEIPVEHTFTITPDTDNENDKRWAEFIKSGKLIPMEGAFFETQEQIDEWYGK